MNNLISYWPALVILGIVFFAWLQKYIIREAIKEAFKEMGITKKE